jgi:tRNA 2-thiouridine synthesizing protein A
MPAVKPGKPANVLTVMRYRLESRSANRLLHTDPMQPPSNLVADKEIDTRGLNCPLPILRAKKALADMGSGQVLKVVSTDPGSNRDFQAFCKQTGNELLGQQVDGKDYLHFLKRR